MRMRASSGFSTAARKRGGQDKWGLNSDMMYNHISARIPGTDQSAALSQVVALYSLGFCLPVGIGL